MTLKAFFCRLLAMAFFLTAAMSLRAQSTTDGAIAATVSDPQGYAVPSAHVVVRNEFTNAEQTVATNTDGYFRSIKLQPGKYTVTITAQGFAKYEVTGVIVEVGQLSQLSPTLAVGEATAEVTVVGGASQVDVESPAFATTMDREKIENLPLNGTRWSDLTVLTPSVVPNSTGFGLISFRGISVLQNNVTIDGADDNQAFFSEERGRSRAGYSTAPASIQEAQVNASNYSVEYGRAAGGVVNSITKSGTNTLHGDAYFFDRDNSWGAINPYTSLTTQTAPGVFTTTPYKPKDWRKVWGFGLGGALIKDKLFFFYAYDQYRHNWPGTSKVGNPTQFFATPDATLPAGQVCAAAGRANPSLSTIDNQACLFQARLGLPTYASAATQYTAGLNALASGDMGAVPRVGDQVINFPRLDWQINSKNRATFEYNRFRWDSPGGIQQTVAANVGANSYGNDYVKIDWGVFKLASFLTPHLTNEVRYQYGRELDYEYSNAPNAYEQPFANNAYGRMPRITLDGSNGLYFGMPIYLERPAYPDERRNQIADTMTWDHGRHQLKWGVDFNHVNDRSENLQYQHGQYTYTTVVNYMTDYFLYLGNPGYTGACDAAGSGVGNLPCYSSYIQGFGPLGYQFATNDYAIFFEDSWKLRPRFTVNLGLRYDYEQLPSPFKNQYNSAYPLTGVMPSDKGNVGPRVGFAWDVFGDAKTSLRGGYGIYYGRVINSTIYNALAQTGVNGQTTYTYSATTPGAPLFPNIFATTPAGTGGAPSVIFFDKNFKLPAAQQVDLSVQRDLGWGTVLSLSYVGAFTRHLPNFADVNVDTAHTTPVTYTIVDPTNAGPLKGTYTTPVYTTRLNPAYSTVTDIFSSVNSSYNAFVAQVSHRAGHNLNISASYTWSHSLDYGQNESTFTDANDLYSPNNLKELYGNSIYDVPNRFIVTAIYTLPFHASGWRGQLLNGWGLSPVFQEQNGLPYSLVTSGKPTAGISSSINGYGGATIIGAVGRNTYRLPTTAVLDLSLSKRFALNERVQLELLGQAFNLANHVNQTQANSTAYTISGTTLTYSPVFGTPLNANNNYVYTSRQIQVAAKLHF